MIKKLRIEKNMTQYDLAEGICSQGMVSKIEKKLIHPDIDLILKIADKLDCTVSQLLGEESTDKQDFTMDRIHRAINQRDYNLIAEELQTESMNNLKKTNFPLYTWIKSIVTAQVDGKVELANKSLLDVLPSLEENNKENIQLKLNILNALSSNYQQLNDLDNALKYLHEAIPLLDYTFIDIILKEKIYFSLARCNSLLEDYEQALFYAQKAIQLAVVENSLHLLDDLYLLLTDTYLKLVMLEKAEDALRKATLLIDIKNSRHLLPYLERAEISLNKLKQQ